MIENFTVHEKTPGKKRYVLKYIAPILLKLSGFSIKGSFPNNERTVLIAVPHTSFYDMYIMFLMVYTLGVDINYLAAKWIFTRIASPFRLYPDPDRQGIPWPLGFIQKKIFIRSGGIPVVRSRNENQVPKIIGELNKKKAFNLVIAPEGGITKNNTLRLGFIPIASELKADVVPIQVDYKNKVFNFLPPLDQNVSKDTLLKNLMESFHGVVGKNKTYNAYE